MLEQMWEVRLAFYDLVRLLLANFRSLVEGKKTKVYNM